MLPAGDSFQVHRLNVCSNDNMEEEIPSKWKPKESRVRSTHMDKLGFKPETVTGEKGGHRIMIKGSVHLEVVIIINMHVPKIRAPKYIRQILKYLNGEMMQ